MSCIRKCRGVRSVAFERRRKSERKRDEKLDQECDYAVGYFRDGYVPYFDRDRKYRRETKTCGIKRLTIGEMTLDEKWMPF